MMTHVPHHRALYLLVWLARVVGVLVIVLSVLAMPALRSLTGALSEKLGTISAVMLGVGGFAWLTAVELFRVFFDRYLSRN